MRSGGGSSTGWRARSNSSSYQPLPASHCWGFTSSTHTTAVGCGRLGCSALAGRVVVGGGCAQPATRQGSGCAAACCLHQPRRRLRGAP